MFIVLGFGNPGKEYVGTYGNVGVAVAEALEEMYNINQVLGGTGTDGYPDILRGYGDLGRKTFVVAKHTCQPEAVGPQLAEYTKTLAIPEEKVVIVYADDDFPAGTVSIGNDNGHGGKLGPKSVLTVMGTEKIVRVRVGVGKGDRTSRQGMSPLRTHLATQINECDCAAILNGIWKAVHGIVKYIDTGSVYSAQAAATAAGASAVVPLITTPTASTISSTPVAKPEIKMLPPKSSDMTVPNTRAPIILAKKNNQHSATSGMTTDATHNAGEIAYLPPRTIPGGPKE